MTTAEQLYVAPDMRIVQDFAEVFAAQTDWSDSSVAHDNLKTDIDCSTLIPDRTVYNC